MKLKRWLERYKNISYAEYKELSYEEQSVFREEHLRFLSNSIKKKSYKSRPMSEEEKAKLELIFAKEKLRYETSIKIGGIDERGNYTALHHRWEQ